MPRKNKSDGLQLDPKNANKGTKRGRSLLEKSLKNYGAGRSILLDKNRVAIAGNKTLEEARKQGFKVKIVKTDGKELIAVQRTDLDLAKDKKAKELAVADNRVSELDLEWDGDMLGALDIDLGDLDFRDSDLKKLGIDVEEETAPEPKLDQAIELQKKWKTKRGQIWSIGKHRLMCGDINQDIASLGSDFNLCVTSPPYFNQRPEYAVFKDYSSFNAFLKKTVVHVIEKTASRFTLVWNTGDNQADCLPMIADQTVLIHESGLVYRETIVWRKAGAVYSIPRSAHIRANNHYYPGLSWEAILVFSKGKKLTSFDATDVEFATANGTNVWEINQVVGSSQGKIGHPAMFPFELANRAVRFYSMKGDSVIEPFNGSGTTMCACEKSGRICYGMEIEPKYIAVALERMSDMGLKPKLL